MRVAISGSRGPDPKRGRTNGWTNIYFIESVMRRLLAHGHTINIGDAPSGVDHHVELIFGNAEWCEAFPEKTVTTWEARWDVEGKAAGSNRNRDMIKMSDALIAIFADGPKTPGTSNAIMWAKKKGIPAYIYHEGVWDVPEPNTLLHGVNQPSQLLERSLSKEARE